MLALHELSDLQIKSEPQSCISGQFLTVGIAAQCFGMNASFDAAYKQPQVPGIEVMPQPHASFP